MNNNGFLDQMLYVASPIIFLILFVFWAVITVILEYHWRNFGVTKNDTKKAKDWYYGASAALFVVIIVSLIIIIL